MERNILPTGARGRRATPTEDYHVFKLIGAPPPGRTSRGTKGSHKEAERRRRERINAHLVTFRSLLPKSNTRKRDKASLLAEVVQRLKQLKKEVQDVAVADPDISSGHSDMSTESLPTLGESDEASLSYCPGGIVGNNMVHAEATICCSDRAGLNRELAKVFRDIQAKVTRTEMATQAGRTRVRVLVELAGGDSEFHELRRALKAVVRNRVNVTDGLGFHGKPNELRT